MTEATNEPPPAAEGVPTRFGMTSGQLWTAVLGTLFSTITLAIGLPPMFARGPAEPATPTRSTAVTSPTPAAAVPSSPGMPGVVALPPPAARAVVDPPTWATMPDEPSFPATPSPVQPGTGSPSTPTPLRVVGGGWTTSAGTSAGAAPAGGYPVSWIGQGPDRQSFLSLTGTASTLTLAVDPSPETSFLAEVAVVWACPVLSSGWRVEPGSSPGAAPASACAQHTVGRRDPTGTSWSFDLSGFLDLALRNGITLAPQAPTTGVAYQVSFTGGEP